MIMRWAKPILLAMGAAVALLVASDVVFAQCSMCRTGLVNSPEGQALAAGFNQGILFLLSVPFLLVGFISFLILNSQRRSGWNREHRLANRPSPLRQPDGVLPHRVT